MIRTYFCNSSRFSASGCSVIVKPLSLWVRATPAAWAASKAAVQTGNSLMAIEFAVKADLLGFAWSISEGIHHIYLLSSLNPAFQDWVG